MEGDPGLPQAVRSTLEGVTLVQVPKVVGGGGEGAALMVAEFAPSPTQLTAEDRVVIGRPVDQGSIGVGVRSWGGDLG